MAAPPSRRRGALPPMKKNRGGMGRLRAGGLLSREMGARALPEDNPSGNNLAGSSSSPGALEVSVGHTPRTDRLIRAANYALPPNQQLLVNIIDKIAHLSRNVRRLNDQVARLGAKEDDRGRIVADLQIDVERLKDEEKNNARLLEDLRNDVAQPQDENDEQLDDVKKSANYDKVASRRSGAVTAQKDLMDMASATKDIEALQIEMERLREDALRPREDDPEHARAAAEREDQYRAQHEELLRRLEETEANQRNTREIVDMRLQQSDVDHKELLTVAEKEVNLLSALRLSVEAFEKDVVRQNEHLEQLTSRLGDLESSHKTVAGKLAYLLNT